MRTVSDPMENPMMIRKTTGLLAALCMVLACHAATTAQEPNTKQEPKAKAKAKKYVDKPGGFTVAFPGKPKQSETELKTAAGKSILNINSVESKEGNAFMVMWNDFPIEVEEDNLGKVLDGAVDGVSKKGEIVTKKNTKFGPDKIPAREVVMDAKEGIRFRILIVMRESRLYQVMVAGPDEFADTDKAKDFVKSFEFSKIIKED